MSHFKFTTSFFNLYQISHHTAAFFSLFAFNLISCGSCYPQYFCSCFAVGETFGCGNTDACFNPQCTTPEQEAEWAALVDTKCDPDAINAILLDYPGMEVLCVDDTAFVTADYVADRVRLFFDATTGLVSRPPKVG